MVSKAETAVELFRNGCACSQAILGAYGPRYGLDERLAMRLGAGFAVGMRMAETCGAVTGAFMVLGLARSADTCKSIEGRQDTYAAVRSFAEKFRERYGCLTCRDLLGCDATTPEGDRFAKEQGLYETRCVEVVRSAAEVLDTLLAET